MKKLLAILLVAVMALGMLPFAASAEEATIEPYGVGMENWSEQTQLLLVASLPSLSDAMAATWTITLNDGTTSKTINMKPSSNYDYGDGSAIYRFQTCLGEGADQFIPVPGTPYTVSATANIGGTDYNFTAAEGETWTFPADLEPIVPEVSYDLTIKPEFGGMENWPGSPNKGEAADAYQLLVGLTGYKGDIPASIKSKDQLFTLKITGSDGSSKTITVKPGSIYSTFLVRFETVLQDKENQFIPVAGVNYTVEVSATDADGKTWSGKSADGAFACPEGFVPTVPAEYDYTQTPVDPPVDPVDPPVDPVDPPVDPVDPPQAGDATALIAVLAVVALFGAAVVTKKVFVK